MKMTRHCNKGNNPVSFFMNDVEPFIYFVITVGDVEKVDPVGAGESAEVELIAT